VEQEERSTGFLPPEPSGPEPELGSKPGREEPAEGQHGAHQGQPQQQQAWQQPQGWQQPGAWQAYGSPHQGQHAAPGQPPPPPGYGYVPPPPGWQPPPPGWQPPPPGYGYGYPPPPREPDNGAAIGGFVTSIVAATLLVMSFGFLGIVSLIAAPFGIHYSRKGRRAVDEGRTPKHRGLAQAGFVIGIITLIFSAIVTILGIIFIIALATDEEFRRDFENDNNFDSTEVRAALLALRLAAGLLI
jgi:hypothetical protein